MPDAIVFVHGTGVRGQAYQRSFRQVRRGLTAGGDQCALSGCFWGATEGVRLSAGGASIPRYPETGGASISDAADELAVWAVLYVDPLYELRLLRTSGGKVELPPGAVPPALVLRDQLAEFAPSAELTAQLIRVGLAELFAPSLELVRGSAEFAAAAATARPDLLEHRQAAARAVVAQMVSTTEENGLPAIDGTSRDMLVRHFTDELGGYGHGIGDRLAASLRGVVARAATRRMARRRGAVTDSAAPLAGDVLRYQADGQGIRRAIHQAILDAQSDHVTLLAHSLGGIASVDLLVMEHVPQVDAIITVGSQAPFLYEIGALTSLAPPAQLPAHFPNWLNIYDPADFLSYVAEALFPGRVTDVEVDNGQPFPQSHSAYWSNDEVWAAVTRFVGS